MVMAEEMTQLWLLSFGDLGSAEDLGYGPLTGDICTRMVYGEYELRQPDRAVYWGWMDWYPVDAGSYSAYYPQISNYGIYTMSELGEHPAVYFAAFKRNASWQRAGMTFL